jgi:hypothetical protein
MQVVEAHGLIRESVEGGVAEGSGLELSVEEATSSSVSKASLYAPRDDIYAR